MGDGTAAIIGALVGAVAGLAGGGFAALASVRASQLAARASLGAILLKMRDAVVAMNVNAKDDDQYLIARREFERSWSDFSIQQRILCPSKLIENLMELVLEIGRNDAAPPKALLNLAGQTMEKITRMVGAHSNHLFRFCAKKEEVKIIRDWLESDEAKLLSEAVRSQLAKLI